MSQKSISVVNYLMLTIKGLSKNCNLWLWDKLVLPVLLVVSRHLTPKPANCVEREARLSPSTPYIIVAVITMSTCVNSANYITEKENCGLQLPFGVLEAKSRQIMDVLLVKSTKTVE